MLQGGRDFWSNGIHLNLIEAAQDPRQESWDTINAMDDLVHAILTATDHITIAALYGSAGAGGVMLALAADREFYVMQGEFYLNGDPARPGLHEGSPQKMATENPDYVVFNGAVGSLAKDTALKARVGDTVRIFFGVGGPNKTSSFHVIGEMFGRLYPEAGTEAVSNVQTTLVPAGGAAIADFRIDYPGSYILVDHSLGRLTKGSAAFLEAEGPADPEIFQPIEAGVSGDSGH